MNKVEKSGRSKGGQARADNLSKKELKEIALSGSEARKNVDSEIAIKSGAIKLDGIVIHCAVLPDKTRVLSERAITKAFGGKRGGSHWKRMKENPGGANLPVFLSAKNIIPFISNDLVNGLTRRRIYKAKEGGYPAHGIEASLLPKICNALLKVRDAKEMHPSQEAIIAQADIIMRGLAEIGIIALVDEATGYIDDKDKEEYRDIFREFIRQQAGDYEKEFPPQFFDSIYRMYEVRKGKPGKHPQFFGKFIRKYIYAPLANSNGAVLDMLDEKNPVVYLNGGRKFKMYQFLTEQVGLPAFKAHLWQVVGIQAASKNKDAFDRNFRRAFPPKGETIDMLED